MPYNEELGWNEPATTREDLAKQAKHAADVAAAKVNVPLAGADALVEAAAQDLGAAETNDLIGEARAPAQAEADEKAAAALNPV